MTKDLLMGVKVIEHSKSVLTGLELFTFSLKYERFFHSEVMTHRMASKNASSSRAIPVNKMVEQVVNNPAMPQHWGANQRGMQADKENNEPVTIKVELREAFDLWSKRLNRDFPIFDSTDEEVKTNLVYKNKRYAIKWFQTLQVDPITAWKFSAYLMGTMSQAFSEADYHKQIANRITEPFQYINVVMTATAETLSGIYRLRDHRDAQPEFRLLAQEIKKAQKSSEPKMLYAGDWHMPYVKWRRDSRTSEQVFYDNDHSIVSLESALQMSAARCARVSYNNHDGTKSTLSKDEALFDQLVGSSPMHASPVEHQATPDFAANAFMKLLGIKQKNHQLAGNLHGWVQYRKLLEQAKRAKDFTV